MSCAPWLFVLGESVVKILDIRVEDVHEDTQDPSLHRVAEHLSRQMQAILGFGPQLLELRIRALHRVLMRRHGSDPRKSPSFGLKRTSISPTCSQSLSLPSAISAGADESRSVLCSLWRWRNTTLALRKEPYQRGSRTQLPFLHTSGHVARCLCTRCAAVPMSSS